MLVTVCGYEHNPSRGVAHTRFRVVHTDGRTYGEVQILMLTQNFVGGIKNTVWCPYAIEIFVFKFG